MPVSAKDLYELTPEEFERLIADLLSESEYSRLKSLDELTRKWVDIFVDRFGQRVAIEIKHKKHFEANELQEFIKKYLSNPNNPRNLVYVTSAEVPQNIENQILQQMSPDLSFQLVSRTDILRLINIHPDVGSRFFRKAKDRISYQRYQLLISLAGVIFSIIALLFAIYSTSYRPPLDKRIQTVENALSNIRDLETYLQTIKQDMVETEKATKVLKDKYLQAKELEKLTQDQVNALKTTLQTENWYRTIFNYSMGFILGVASSFLASVLYTKWRQKKALE